MKQIQSSRRTFVGTIAAGATGLLSVPSAMLARSVEASGGGDADAWFKKVKGKHRIVYDATEPHNGFPMIWTWVFYKTNNDTGTPDNDMTAVVILRHNAIPFAMEDRLWAKYKFGETFKVMDNNTNMSALRNPLWMPQEKDYPLPGIDGMKALQDRGVMFAVCDMAIRVYSGFAAKELEADPEEVRQDWLSGVLPGIQVVPSGVWALGRAQENGCAYCYAGG